MTHSRILFILKRREDYSQDPSYSVEGVSTGLLNSASFVKDMLRNEGFESKLVVVADNNDIDREVNKYKPTHVIIEALWVVPEKFDVLTRLHPTVQWIIRFHSETPFIASEGIATRWLAGYFKRPNIILGINAPRFMKEVKSILLAAGYSRHEINRRIQYMPNYYPVGQYVAPRCDTYVSHVNVGCFGAIRPLKNQLLQAIAALQFARKIGKKLRFHINVGRTEMKGEPILHNLQGLFASVADQGHELVIHQWMPHGDFLEIVSQMDIGMQVSFSETFNIVAADMLTRGVPMVMSDEMPWAWAGKADPTECDDIVRKMLFAYRFKWFNVFWNWLGLKMYVAKTKRIWSNLFVK